MSEISTRALEELDRVALKRAVAGDEGQSLPAGSAGTIVAVLEHDLEFLVEFTRPVATLVAIDARDLEAVPGKRRHDLPAARVDRRAS